METLRPEVGVVAHFPRRVAHDRLQVLTDERALEVARGLIGVDDRWTGGDERLQVLHGGPALAQGLLRPLAVGDVRPGPDDLHRLPRWIPHDRKGVLDPDVVSLSMPEAVLDGAAAL